MICSLFQETSTVVYPDRQRQKIFVFRSPVYVLDSDRYVIALYVCTHFQTHFSVVLNLQQELMECRPGEKWRWECRTSLGFGTDDLTLNFSPVKGTQPSPVTALVAAGCPSCRWVSEELVSVQPSLMLCPFIPMRETVYAGAGAEIHQLSCEQWTTFFLLTLNSGLVQKKEKDRLHKNKNFEFRLCQGK